MTNKYEDLYPITQESIAYSAKLRYGCCRVEDDGGWYLCSYHTGMEDALDIQESQTQETFKVMREWAQEIGKAEVDTLDGFKEVWDAFDKVRTALHEKKMQADDSHD